MEKSEKFSFNLPSSNSDDIADINQISDNFRNIDKNIPSMQDVNEMLEAKQDTLASGINIKTINHQTILGEGNIDIENEIEVDQTYHPDSENAQSGKAVAEAIANVSGGGGNIYVDQEYSPTSKNAQSGKAVEQAIAGINSLGDVTMHGNIAMQGGKITQLPEPTDSADAVNKRYADNLLSANDAMVFKGTLGTGGTITSVPTPSSNYTVGWTYKIITAGTYVGQKCEVGDMLISVADASSYSGNPYNIVNEHWVVVQSNIDAQALINDALAQAKASGEFDGADGKDGISVTVKSVSESTADGDSNVVTFSDGKTLTIKNGSKGSQGIQGIQGEKGEQGIQGEKGKDGANGKDGVSATHSWNGTTLTITSASGTSSANLKGEKGDKGDKGDTGAPGAAGADGKTPVKGTDYFTAADKTELVNLVLANFADVSEVAL